MEMKPTFMPRSCHEFGQGVSLANPAWPTSLKIFWPPLKKSKKREKENGDRSHLAALNSTFTTWTLHWQRAGSMVGSMATKTKSATNPEMTAEEIAAVKEGMADFAAGRVLTEEQFDEEMRRYFERRETQAGRRHARG